MAAKLALQGFQKSQTLVVDPRKPYCDSPVLLQRRVRAGGYDRSLEVNAFRPCRRCAKCLQFRQMQWRQRALNEIARANRTWMVTLTFAPTHLAGLYAERAVANFEGLRGLDRVAYPHVQKYLKRVRKFSKAKIRYLCVFELGEKSGRAHYHALLHEVGEQPVTKACLQGQWRSHVHAKLVANGRGSASYITKYATKSLDIRPRASSGYGKTMI